MGLPNETACKSAFVSLHRIPWSCYRRRSRRQTAVWVLFSTTGSRTSLGYVISSFTRRELSIEHKKETNLQPWQKTTPDAEKARDNIPYVSTLGQSRLSKNSMKMDFDMNDSGRDLQLALIDSGSKNTLSRGTCTHPLTCRRLRSKCTHHSLNDNESHLVIHKLRLRTGSGLAEDSKWRGIALVSGQEHIPL